MEQKWVVFSLGTNTYGIDVQSVRSIERVQPVTRVPNAPAHVKASSICAVSSRLSSTFASASGMRRLNRPTRLGF